MFKWSRVLFSIVFLLIASATLSAQSANTTSPAEDKLQARRVFGSVTGEAIRFTSLGELIQMRLEVIDATGAVLFDSGFKSGNLVDWTLTDTLGQRLRDGSYLCVVTVKESSSQTTRVHAIGSLRDQSVSLTKAVISMLTAAQVQAAGTTPDESSSLTVIEPGQSTGTAVLAHDGVAAQLVSGSGGLSIGSGDFFANKILEHIRLTAEGNVGIGLLNPQAKLDVAGMIRASEGIIFPDGSIQFSASRKTYGAESLRPGQTQKKGAQGGDVRTESPDTSGTGTTGKIPKWSDGPNGVLTDANMTEASGAIGINGTPNTSFRLDVNGSVLFRGSNPGFNLVGLRPAGNQWVFQTVDDDGRFRLFSQDNVNPGVERLTIGLSTGNVGIGATTPAAKLDVAGAINTSTQYNIGGARMLSAPGSENVFVGLNAGSANTSGIGNTFFGALAGQSNNVQGDNSFFGNHAGKLTTVGSNSFFGASAGESNSTGGSNAFFGINAGFFNSSGAANAFFGANAGVTNGTGSSLTIVGASADVNASNLTNATAIGAHAFVAQSNSLVLGSINGINNATADTRVGIGTSAPVKHIHVKGAGDQEIAIESSDVGGRQWTLQSSRGSSNGRFEIVDRTAPASRFSILDSGDVGIGTTTPNAKLHIAANGGQILIGDAGCGAGFTGVGFATTLSGCTGFSLLGNGTRTIINTPLNGSMFFTNGGTAEQMVIGPTGVVQIFNLGGASGGNHQLCFTDQSELTICGSSIRYKTNINSFNSSLDLIKRLRPVSFNWKKSGEPDFGLVAEEVAEVEPLLVTHNKDGRIEGVKYDRVGVVLVNAVKEQQTQIEQQQAQIKTQQLLIQHQQTEAKRQQAEIDSLKRWVCGSHPRAAICKRRQVSGRPE